MSVSNSVSNYQSQAEEYAIKNCVYNKGKKQETLSPTCEMSLTENSYVARPTTADQRDGYHNIEGYGYVKPVLSSDTTKNFGAIIRIEDIEGGTIDMNSEKGKALLQKPEFVEVYSRTIAFMKFTAHTTVNEGFKLSDLSPFTRSSDKLEAATKAIEKTGDTNLNDAWNRINPKFWAFTSYEGLDTPGHSPEISNVPIQTKDGDVNTIDSEIEKENKTVENLDTNNGLGEIFKLHPVLKYPYDAAYGSGGQDYIRFETFKYEPPNKGAFGKSNKYDAGEKGKNKVQVIETLKGESIPRNSNLGEYGNTIKLPIPNDLRVSNGVEWGGAKANAIEMAAFQSATNKIDDVKNGGFNTLFNGMDNIGKLFDTIKKLDVDDQAGGTALTALLAKTMLSAVNINVDTNQFIARSLGIAINPNLELLFSSPKLRNFTFRFDFAPNGEKDAEMSRRIMRVFRQGMQPTGYGGRRVNSETGARFGTSNIFIGAPRVFRIGYFNGSNRIRGLPVHKICALTQVSTNFTPENVYQSYADSRAVSNPVRTTMELAFTELTPIFAEDYLGDGDGGTEQQLDNKSLFDLNNTSGHDAGILNGDNALNTEDIGF